MTHPLTEREYILLGGGGVTAEYYLPALAIRGMLAKTVVVDASEENLRPLEQTFQGILPICGNFQDAFVACAPNARERGAKAVVALPNHLHVDAVRAALTNGFHVLCEKPLALHAEDCTQLRAFADSEARLLKEIGRAHV